MKKKCLNCKLVNYSNAENCARCESVLIEVSTVGDKNSLKNVILRRAVICLVVCILTIAGFYLSLIFTSKSLNYNQKIQVEKAITILREKEFSDEVFLLDYATAYRENDNWLNASTKTENAYAATNFPFEIMTVYNDFFELTKDDTERAAILLHEAQHLQG